ncbi:MAG: SDR family oxidoreductase [Gemmatimonadaceae bacterium]|nr:SDR family oxidoreductase [Gemmatimonadaceae bacterium]
MSTVLVTGTSRGIGLATALAFARAGHTVAATMRNPAAAPELARAAASERLAVSVFTMDVDDDASVQQAVRRIEAELGPVDVLVNNAGIERTGSVEEMPVSAFRDVMETNCFGAIRCIQAVLPGMRARRSGCIVNVTSISGKLATSPMGAYAASKFALEAVSECLAQEVKPFGIRVCVVEPGIIDTDMARHISVAGDASAYPNQRRMAAMFVAALQQPTPPDVVADKLVEIADGGSWQFRHPVGPDAAPFLQWRASLSDEAWVEWGALDDDAWYARVQADPGMDARPSVV